MKPSLFGVPIEGRTFRDILEAIVASQAAYWIVTANPEILLTASEQPAYKAALCAADERTVDGMGLWFVLRSRGHRVHRLTGVDLGEALLREARVRRWRVALFGGADGVARQTAELWAKRLPEIHIASWSGGRVREDGSEDGKTWEDREAMMRWRPDIILCALGGGTKQERWIAAHRETFASAKAVVGVGGAFDMWTGRLPRAPRLVRMIGLEWLWRWILEPSRARRMWRATAVFLWRAIREKG